MKIKFSIHWDSVFDVFRENSEYLKMYNSWESHYGGSFDSRIKPNIDIAKMKY